MDYDKAIKLLNLAVDPAASSAEADQASRMFVKLVKEAKIRPEDLFKLKILKVETIVYKDLSNKPAGDTIMPFGKYANTPFNQIPEDYLDWVLKNCKSMSNSTAKKLCEYRGVDYTKWSNTI